MTSSADTVGTPHGDLGSPTPSADVASLKIALVGYGEVGRILGAALTKAGVGAVTAFDVLITDPSWVATARPRAERDGVVLVSGTAEAVESADLIVSAVTAAATASAAQQIASACRHGAFVLDVNSASPYTKTECAQIVERAGSRYVEAAVMSSVPPHGIRVPMLLGGPYAHMLQSTLASLGFRASIGSTSYGVVSAIKLCRSVIVKGMQALAVESLLAARRYGVEEQVLASLAETFPGLDWERQAAWFWGRMVQHGRRHAEEMREAALTVRDAGIVPRMTTAMADLQTWMAALQAAGVFAEASSERAWRDLADSIKREIADQKQAAD
jgi:3-hydroxyisobutyrate dehydrogenase